jgi:hypothetical protein
MVLSFGILLAAYYETVMLTARNILLRKSPQPPFRKVGILSGFPPSRE